MYSVHTVLGGVRAGQHRDGPGGGIRGAHGRLQPRPLPGGLVPQGTVWENKKAIPWKDDIVLSSFPYCRCEYFSRRCTQRVMVQTWLFGVLTPLMFNIGWRFGRVMLFQGSVLGSPFIPLFRLGPKFFLTKKIKEINGSLHAVLRHRIRIRSEP